MLVKELTEQQRMKKNLNYFNSYKTTLEDGIISVNYHIQNSGVNSNETKTTLEDFERTLNKIEIEMQEVVGNSHSLSTKYMLDLERDFFKLKVNAYAGDLISQW